MKKRLLSMVCAVMILLSCGGMIMVHSDGSVLAASAASPPILDVGAGKLLVQPCSADIIRVRYAPDGVFRDKTLNTYLDPNWHPDFSDYTVTDDGTTITVATADLKAVVQKSDGRVSFYNPDGSLILSERGRSSTPVTLRSTCPGPWFKVSQEFLSPPDEALYGFGNVCGDDVVNNLSTGNLTDPKSVVMGFKGQAINFQQNNVRKRTPMFWSNQGYGILFDVTSNGSLTWGNDSGVPNGVYTFIGNAADSMDYYFLNGPGADKVISGYRTVTGQATMLPKNAFGYMQSRDRYASQSEIQTLVQNFRSRNIPLDTVVIDYQWWDNGPGDWTVSWFNNIMKWNSNFPDPTGMMNNVHSQNVSAAISVWPTFRKGTVTSDYILSQNPNFFIEDGANPNGQFAGYTMDISSQSNRDLYWRLINENVFSHGLDTIWLDADEPEFSDWTTDSGATIAYGDTRPISMIYSLLSNQTVYNGERSVAGNTKRVDSLSRSAVAGDQRYGMQSWSGDIYANWNIFKSQIPGVINYSASGLPYFSTDTGGYWPTDNGGAILPSYDELFTRWLEFSTFSSIMRVHGNTNYREPWRFPEYQDVITNMINLRERLLPYIYSLAGQVTQDDYTIVRPLAFDFPKDPNAAHITDQYMFGSALMVAPVTDQGATQRDVYLPAGKWVDFWTGATVDSAGQTYTVNAPISQIPVFVRAGSVVPMGPQQQYATQSSDPMELRVYMGADGSFKLYEDEGNNYNYENGKFSEIPFTWNEADKTLTVGNRTGSFDGMLQNRTFNIVFVQPGYGGGEDLSKAYQTSISYNGTAQSVVFDPKWETPPAPLDPATLPVPKPVPQPEHADKAMVGEWTLDENQGDTAHDTSGNFNNAAILPNANRWTEGKVNSAVGFTGGSAAAGGTYLDVPDSPSLQLQNAVSFSGWVYFTGNSHANIINKGGNGVNNPGFSLILYDGAKLQLEIQTPLSNGVTVKTTAVAPGTFPANAWTHVAFTWQSPDTGGDGIVRLYVNGTQVTDDGAAANYFKGPIGTNARDLRFGCSDISEPDYPNYFKGILDELRLYNYALPAADIARLAALQPLGGVPNPTGVDMAPHSGGFDLTWTDPTDPALQNIQVDYRPVDTPDAAPTAVTVAKGAQKLSVDGLQNGAYYYVTVYAADTGGGLSQGVWLIGAASGYPSGLECLVTHDEILYGTLRNNGMDALTGDVTAKVYDSGGALVGTFTQPNVTVRGMGTAAFSIGIGAYADGQIVTVSFADGSTLLALPQTVGRTHIYTPQEDAAYYRALLGAALAQTVSAADYTPESYALYAAAKPAAQAVYDSADAAADQLLSALDSLRYALVLAPPAYKLGDVNSDGKVDTVDARMVLQKIVGKLTLDPTQLLAADVNGDNKIDTVDARLILQKIVNKIDKFPIE